MCRNEMENGGSVHLYVHEACYMYIRMGHCVYRDGSHTIRILHFSLSYSLLVYMHVHVYDYKYALVAQLVEHPPRTWSVVGLNPTRDILLWVYIFTLPFFSCMPLGVEIGGLISLTSLIFLFIRLVALFRIRVPGFDSAS